MPTKRRGRPPAINVGSTGRNFQLPVFMQEYVQGLADENYTSASAALRKIISEHMEMTKGVAV